MVQFIREQMRNYNADQTEAIGLAQTAQNISELNQAIQSVGGIAKSVMASREKAVKEAEKAAANADEQMINTQAVSRLDNDLLEWNVRQIESGVDPSSEEYTKRLYAKRDELFQPYIDQMTSEKGRSYLQKQGLESAERIRRSNIGKIAENRKKAQARQAFVDTAKNMKNEARDFGKLGDWEGFKEAVKDDRKAMIDYAKANGNKDTAEFAVDSNNITNYMSGVAETEPETVIAMLGDKDSMKEIVYDRIEKEKPGLSDKKKEEIFEDMYESANQEQVGKEALLAVVPESVLKQYTDSFVAAKKEEQAEIKDRMKELPKDSKAYKSLESRLEENKSQLEALQDGAVETLRTDLKKTVLPIAKEQLGKNKLLEQKVAEESVIDTYRSVLNPNTSVSFEAQMALSLGQPAVEQLFQHSISDEEMHKAYDAYAQAKTEVLTRNYATTEGTEAMIDAYRKVLQHDPADQIGAIKEAFDGFVALHRAPVTQKQIDNYQNAMYASLQDNAFADLMRSFTAIQDIYTPDTNWFENALGRVNTSMVGDANTPEGVKLAEMGLVSKAVMAQDKDTVEKFFKNKVVEITNNTGGMLALAATEQNPEARKLLGQKAIDYYTTEKRKAFDYAMQNFGIDMGALREAYKSGREVITNVGGKTVRYLGDDSSTGLPNFEPYIDEAKTKSAIDRILGAAKLLLSM